MRTASLSHLRLERDLQDRRKREMAHRKWGFLVLFPETIPHSTDVCMDYMKRVALDHTARVGLRKMASPRVEMAMPLSGQARLWMLLWSFIHFNMAQSQTVNFYVPQMCPEIASRTSRHERATDRNKGCLHGNVYGLMTTLGLFSMEGWHWRSDGPSPVMAPSLAPPKLRCHPWKVTTS